MNQPAIKQALQQKHAELSEFIINLSVSEFSRSNNSKWSPAQQLDHIYRSIKPLRIVLNFPKKALQLIWGKANRKSRTYGEVVQKYQDKLANGGRAGGRFIPKAIPENKRLVLSTQIETELRKLLKAVDSFTEAELDRFIIPHPLLGKLTIREMLYFTIYHAEHHFKLTIRDLG